MQCPSVGGGMSSSVCESMHNEDTLHYRGIKHLSTNLSQKNFDDSKNMEIK